MNTKKPSADDEIMTISINPEVLLFQSESLFHKIRCGDLVTIAIPTDCHEEEWELDIQYVTGEAQNATAIGWILHSDDAEDWVISMRDNQLLIDIPYILVANPCNVLDVVHDGKSLKQPFSSIFKRPAKPRKTKTRKTKTHG